MAVKRKKREQRLPDWFRVPFPGKNNYVKVHGLLTSKGLNTVCQSALCPNRGECFGQGTATFLIMGSVCTRNCSFCHVEHGQPGLVDFSEPSRVAEAVALLELRHAVITSVTRDDLADGGANLFGATVEEIRRTNPGISIEVLIPDFQGSIEALEIVLHSKPDILNHNIETVKRLYPIVRPQAVYLRSLELLRQVKELSPTTTTKSGLMVGFGEMREELIEACADLRAQGCEMLTIGQYLAPSARHHQVLKYYDPAEFEEFRERAVDMGFSVVQSGPLVRSSYHARESIADRRRGHDPDHEPFSTNHHLTE